MVNTCSLHMFGKYLTADHREQNHDDCSGEQCAQPCISGVRDICYAEIITDAHGLSHEKSDSRAPCGSLKSDWERHDLCSSESEGQCLQCFMPLRETSVISGWMTMEFSRICSVLLKVTKWTLDPLFTDACKRDLNGFGAARFGHLFKKRYLFYRVHSEVNDQALHILPLSYLIQNVDHTNFLGIIIDKHLSFKPHINKVNTKISQITGILNRLKHQFPQHILLTIYQSLIIPHITYGALT
ncbi:hypothetical protein CAPTEDRAFT_193350 [Capitella teleta]|uniref:Uncharacterized protein n=1 Tax=Capitella teleta TaxID=283909 RepID=R7UU85_CAPTE|nr:hypothetical protein CAPTEDRAFT_193350 [Capitella teleta]|eukprot:ELU10049.1 hypothetical protein CAPTEDRAFT_193350 [Capitella teleta]